MKNGCDDKNGERGGEGVLGRILRASAWVMVGEVKRRGQLFRE